MRAGLAPWCIALLAGGCASPAPYVYRPDPCRVAVLGNDGRAVAPELAPARVRVVIEAGNRIAGLPYRLGGGHGRALDDAYDCSGAASYVLGAAGLLDGPIASREFRKYGRRGPGRWISVYARRGHVFLSVAGLRFDTGWNRGEPRGPRWSTRSRSTRGCVVRHPAAL